MAGAIALLKDIKPANKIEGMLATQMVPTHSAAMECLRRALLSNQTFEGPQAEFEACGKAAIDLCGSNGCPKQEPGNGQQKVTVKHIHARLVHKPWLAMFMLDLIR